MKKMIFAGALVILASATKAQTEKGNLMVGGTLGGINFSSTGSNQVFSIGVSPNIGKFVIDNLAVGGSLDMMYTKPKDVNGSFDFGVAPLVRYYFMREGANGLYGQARFGVGVHTFDDENPATDNSSTTLLYGVGVGYNRFFTKNVALEVGLGYTAYDPTRDNLKTTHNVGLNVGFQIFLPTKTAKAMLKK